MAHSRIITSIVLSLAAFPLFAQQDTIQVFFEHNVHDRFDKQALTQQVKQLVESERVRVIGYTDHLGSSDYNQVLSDKRAAAVASWLGKQGVEASIEGKGELNSALDEEGVPTDRRVDVVFSIPMEKKVETVDKQGIEQQEKAGEPIVLPPLPEAEEPETYTVDSVSKENIVLEGLSFIGGRHYPLPESEPVLMKLLKTMKRYPSLKIEIQGFICCEYEQKDGYDLDTGEPFLSANRARYVYDYLKANGIDPERMRYKGYGSTQPKVYPEVTEEDRQANRRVEIKILEY